MELLHGQFIVDGETIKSLTPDDDDIIIEGYAADYEKDREGERFLPGAFDEAVKKAAEGKIPLLLEHNNNRPLGLVEELRPDDRGLWMRGRIAAKAVAEAWDGAKGQVEMIRRGVMKGLSVRGRSWGKMTSNGPVLGYIDLAEVSVTPVGMQPGALFAVVQKSLTAEGMTTAEDVAYSTEGFTRMIKDHDPEVVRAAVDKFYKDRIKDYKKRLKDANEVLDRVLG